MNSKAGIWLLEIQEKYKNCWLSGFYSFASINEYYSTKYENGYKVIPNEIIISGKAYKNSRKGFIKN